MKIRLQRGTLGESMETMEHIQPSVEAVKEYLMRNGHTHGVISVTNTGRLDERNGWQTYIVSLNGCAVAFTDGAFCEVW